MIRCSDPKCPSRRTNNAMFRVEVIVDQDRYIYEDESQHILEETPEAFICTECDSVAEDSHLQVVK